MNKNNKIIASLIAVMGGLIIAVIMVLPSWATIGTEVPTVTMGRQLEYNFFASSTAPTITATTTTATSTNIESWTDSTTGKNYHGYFVIAGAKSVNFLFQRGDTSGVGNTGTTTFKVQVTEDTTPVEADWKDYEHLQRVTTSTTADGYYTRVASTNSGASPTNVGAATSTLIYKMDNLGWYAVRAIVVEETDGEHSVSAVAEF